MSHNWWVICIIARIYCTCSWPCLPDRVAWPHNAWVIRLTSFIDLLMTSYLWLIHLLIFDLLFATTKSQPFKTLYLYCYFNVQLFMIYNFVFILRKTINMNGNWGGIASQDFERPNRHIEGLEDPSLDVINTIVSSQTINVFWKIMCSRTTLKIN